MWQRGYGPAPRRLTIAIWLWGLALGLGGEAVAFAGDATYAALRAVDPNYAALRAVDPSYAALRAARPDGRVVPAQGVVLVRDAFRFEFEQGSFHLMAPVAGRTVGAVFIGRGRFRLTPASPAERRQLTHFVGDRDKLEVLDDSFEELVLLFTDDTAQEIEGLPPRTAAGALGAGTAGGGPPARPAAARGTADPHAAQVCERWLKRQRKDFRLNLQARLLADLLGAPGPGSGVFLALFEGRKIPPALAAVDPRGAEALGLGGRLGDEETVLFAPALRQSGIWYASHRGDADVRRGGPPARQVLPVHYKVETTVQRNTDIQGKTTVRFRVLAPGLRVLPIHLLDKLRIGAAAFQLLPAPVAESGGSKPPAGERRTEPVAAEPAAWQPVALIQEAADEDAGPAVVFPQPLPRDSTVLLQLSYGGDSVLVDEGDKNFAVEARTSWYANLGVFSDRATFELVYSVPEGNEIVSVGQEVEKRREGRQTVSVWKSDIPIEVAGFNYGSFKKLERRDEVSGIALAVYTNPSTPNAIRELQSLDLPGFGRVNTTRLAESALVDGINAARVFTTFFGPLLTKQVAITQQSQFSFGQSWPSLIFLPYMAFLDSSQRQVIGLARARYFVDEVGFPEFAHQWWGHLVTARSYRDVWLEEGFAEFSAALALQHTQGWGAYDDFWSRARKNVLAKPPGNVFPNNEAGPITQGFRLATTRSPAAYQALVYSKGAYVVHMLRMMMRNSDPHATDDRFIAMMKDFTATYGGKQATTADFQGVVERHMTPKMNLAGDGRMDWFFRQWVDGSEIPHYSADLKLEPDGEKTRITGKVSQENVSADFRALVPIYLELDRGQFVLLGQLAMKGPATVPLNVSLKLPKKARKAVINLHGDVLARD